MKVGDCVRMKGLDGPPMLLTRRFASPSTDDAAVQLVEVGWWNGADFKRMTTAEDCVEFIGDRSPEVGPP